MNKNTVEIRRKILQEFLCNLDIISNKSYQKIVWIEAKGPKVHSFDNAVCDFFDLGEYIFENYQGYNITEQQQEILEQFRKEFEAFADENDWPPFFIESPEWEKITEMAKDVLAAFNYVRK